VNEKTYIRSVRRIDMNKINIITFYISVFCYIIGIIFLFLRNFYYLGIFMALALGITFFRYSKGIVVVCVGLIIFNASLFQFNFIPWQIGISFMILGFLLYLWERKKTKDEIQKTIIEEGFAQSPKNIKISIAEVPYSLSINKKTFGSYFIPYKRLVKIKIKGKTELYFFDIEKKKLYKAKN